MFLPQKGTIVTVYVGSRKWQRNLHFKSNPNLARQTLCTRRKIVGEAITSGSVIGQLVLRDGCVQYSCSPSRDMCWSFTLSRCTGEGQRRRRECKCRGTRSTSRRLRSAAFPRTCRCRTPRHGRWRSECNRRSSRWSCSTASRLGRQFCRFLWQEAKAE